MDSQLKYFILAMFTQVLFPYVTMPMMFTRKRKAVKDKLIRASYFKLNNDQSTNVPENIVVVSNHYDNLFQMPILFLVTAVLVITLNLVDFYTLVFSWLFVLTRLIHSFVHLGKNYLPHRYTIFGISSLVLLGMWFYIIGKIFFS